MNNMSTVKHEDQLRKIFSNVNDWLKFAEAKNFGLLSLNVAIFFGFAKSGFAEYIPLCKVFIFILLLLFILSFLSCLISLFPILSSIERGTYSKSWINKFSNWIDKEMKFENIHFYGYLKDLNDENEFETKYLSKIGSQEKFSQYEKELVAQILYNSRITWLKYQLFKIGAFLFLLGIIVSILSLAFH